MEVLFRVSFYFRKLPRYTRNRAVLQNCVCEVEDLSEIKQFPTTVAGYTEFLNRILAYKTASFDVKIGVESTKKTDRHDASTISEFLAKDMLPESYICSKETENLRRLLKSRERLVRSVVGQKNEVHALLVSMGLNDELRSILRTCSMGTGFKQNCSSWKNNEAWASGIENSFCSVSVGNSSLR